MKKALGRYRPLVNHTKSNLGLRGSTSFHVSRTLHNNNAYFNVHQQLSAPSLYLQQPLFSPFHTRRSFQTRIFASLYSSTTFEDHAHYLCVYLPLSQISQIKIQFPFVIWHSSLIFDLLLLYFFFSFIGTSSRAGAGVSTLPLLT
jgi:hypothetical protein